MADVKTKPTTANVHEFLANAAGAKRIADCERILQMMMDASGEEPKMWGPSIIGFGSYHYKYDSGHEGDMCMIGFSPRKGNIVLYLSPEFPGREELMSKLGKYKESVACIYIKKLADVDVSVLQKLIEESVKFVNFRT